MYQKKIHYPFYIHVFLCRGNLNTFHSMNFQLFNIPLLLHKALIYMYSILKPFLFLNIHNCLIHTQLFLISYLQLDHLFTNFTSITIQSICNKINSNIFIHYIPIKNEFQMNSVVGIFLVCQATSFNNNT